MEFAGYGTTIARSLDLDFPVPDSFFKKYNNSRQIEDALFDIMDKGLVEINFSGSGLEENDKILIEGYFHTDKVAKISKEIRQIKAQLKGLMEK